VISSIVRKMKIEPKRFHYRDNRFHFDMLAIDPHQEVIDRKKLSPWSRQLAYADPHDVFAYFLLGLLWQCRPSVDMGRKLRAGVKEPWYGSQS